MSAKTQISLNGEVMYCNSFDAKDKAGKTYTTYTIGFIGGKISGLFAKEDVLLKLGSKGTFEIELKLVELQDDKGYKKQAYVPSTIIDFASEVSAKLLKA